MFSLFVFSSLIFFFFYINGFKGVIFEYLRLVSFFLVVVVNINKDLNVFFGIQLNVVINIIKLMNVFDNLKVGKICYYCLFLDKLYLYVRKMVIFVSRKLQIIVVFYFFN